MQYMFSEFSSQYSLSTLLNRTRFDRNSCSELTEYTELKTNLRQDKQLDAKQNTDSNLQKRNKETTRGTEETTRLGQKQTQIGPK